MKQEIYQHAQELYQKSEYQKCLDYIEVNIWKVIPDLKLYNIKNRCLEELGRERLVTDFPWELINYQYPTETDIEAVEHIAKGMKKRLVDNFYYKYHLRSLRMQGIDDREERLEHLKGLFSKAKTNGKINEQAVQDLLCYANAMDDSIKAAYYSAVYLHMIHKEKNVKEGLIENLLLQEKNMGMLYEMLFSDSTDSIAFVVEQEKDYYLYFYMAQLCSLLDKRPYFITMPIEWEVDGDIPSPDTTLQLIYENAEEIDGVTCMTTVNYTKNGKVLEKSLLVLLNDLSHQCKGEQLLLFAERATLRGMQSSYVKRNVIHYVAANEGYQSLPYQTNFAYINGYANYAYQLYGINLYDEINKPSTVRFSIVIPVRNNADTLAYTLKTCLNQNFDNYEILVCDNSDDDQQEIPKLIQEQFCTEKIRYIRTPRVLPITKSFEYAYLMARGEYLIPIGSDDGVVFGAVKYLDAKIKELSADGVINVLTWDRIHYVWSGWNETGQESQMIIPRPYRKGHCEVEKRDSLRMLKDVLIYPSMMYSMPLIYINSGMRRQYMLEMLEQTGAILDGHSQDLYTGVVNLALNPSYYHLKYPITVAALSGHSSGGRSAIGMTTDIVVEERTSEYFLTNIATPIQRDGEDIFMVSDGDVANMLTQVMRLVDMQCLDKQIMPNVYWQNIGKEILEQLQGKDLLREKVQCVLLNGIRGFSSKAADDLIQEIRNHAIRPNQYDGVQEKQYKKGFTEQGALHIDASEFGVENVYDACTLFDHLYHIY